MARKTPQELAAARRARDAERRAEEEAAGQRAEWLNESYDRLSQLEIAVGGIYDELDKFARKWPAMPVTARTVERTNKVLASVRDLLEGQEDEFLDGLADIVPAGDMPETRDMLMTLREAKDALKRFRSRYGVEFTRISLNRPLM